MSIVYKHCTLQLADVLCGQMVKLELDVLINLEHWAVYVTITTNK